MEKSFFTSRQVNKFFPNVLRRSVLSLVRQRIIREEHLKSPDKLLEIIVKNVDRAIDNVEYTVAIEQEFIEAAIENWKRNNKLVGIVLYATAVEQLVNQIHAIMLKKHGMTKDEVEKAIRSFNIESKLSWLLKMITAKEFPKALLKRLHTIFKLRNSIVHFKGIQSHPDARSDSYSKIENELEKLKRLSFSRDFRLLVQSLQKILWEKDPDYELANRASELVLSFRKKSKV
jgi:hypothetical protein